MPGVERALRSDAAAPDAGIGLRYRRPKKRRNCNLPLLSLRRRCTPLNALTSGSPSLTSIRTMHQSPIPAVSPVRCGCHEPPEPAAGASVPPGIGSSQVDSSYIMRGCVTRVSTTHPAGRYVSSLRHPDRRIGPPILQRSARSFFARWTTVTPAVLDYKLPYCWRALCRAPASPRIRLLTRARPKFGWRARSNKGTRSLQRRPPCNRCTINMHRILAGRCRCGGARQPPSAVAPGRPLVGSAERAKVSRKPGTGQR